MSQGHLTRMDIAARRRMAPSILVQNSEGELTLKHVTDKQTTSSGLELSAMDKYTAGIELSNACRSYYARRLRASEGMKRKLTTPPSSSSSSYSSSSASSSSYSCADGKTFSVQSDSANCDVNRTERKTAEEEDVDEDEGYTTHKPSPRKHTSIDKAMDTLRNELVSYFCLLSLLVIHLVYLVHRSNKSV